MELETCLAAPNDWERVSVADVCSKFTSGGTPSRKKPEFFQNGVLPWIKTKELLDVVLDGAEEWITESAIQASSAKRLPRDTVLMAMYGATVGQLGVLGREMACNQACAAMVVDRARCDHRFLYYQLLANRRQIVSMATGAAQQNLSGTQIKSWIIPLAPRAEQERIADFLWYMDERISLLRQTNATLEAVAQALFKSWFVDFDPVHAKAEGREPEAMDAATAALFPSEFEESEQGLIPKGWSAGTLKNICKVHDSKRVPLSGLEREKRRGAYPYYGAASVMDYIDDYIFDGVYVLLAEDGSVATKDGFALTQYVWGRFWVNNHAHILDGVGGFSVEQLLLLLQRVHIHEYITGAVQAKLSQRNMFTIPAVIPPETISKAFNAYVSPLFAKIREGVEALDTLIKLRDTLLPRLISGKLRLPNAEREIEAVV